MSEHKHLLTLPSSISTALEAGIPYDNSFREGMEKALERIAEIPNEGKKFRSLEKGKADLNVAY